MHIARSPKNNEYKIYFFYLLVLTFIYPVSPRTYFYFIWYIANTHIITYLMLYIPVLCPPLSYFEYPILCIGEILSWCQKKNRRRTLIFYICIFRKACMHIDFFGIYIASRIGKNIVYISAIWSIVLIFTKFSI